MAEGPIQSTAAPMAVEGAAQVADSSAAGAADGAGAQPADDGAAEAAEPVHTVVELLSGVEAATAFRADRRLRGVPNAYNESMSGSIFPEKLHSFLHCTLHDSEVAAAAVA